MANITITRDTENFKCAYCSGTELNTYIYAKRSSQQNGVINIDITNIDELINTLIDLKTDIEAVSFQGKVR